MQTVCNKCGQSFEYASDMQVNFGYGSVYDMETWEFYICDDCIQELVKSFKIAPKGFKDDEYNPRLTSEQHQLTFNNWKDTGKWEEMMYIPYDELISYRGYFEDEYINNCIRKYHPNKELLM